MSFTLSDFSKLQGAALSAADFRDLIAALKGADLAQYATTHPDDLLALCKILSLSGERDLEVSAWTALTQQTSVRGQAVHGLCRAYQSAGKADKALNWLNAETPQDRPVFAERIRLLGDMSEEARREYMGSLLEKAGNTLGELICVHALETSLANRERKKREYLKTIEQEYASMQHGLACLSLLCEFDGKNSLASAYLHLAGTRDSNSRL